MDMTPEQIEEMCERAAAKALKAVGLDDEHAARDVLELRGLLDSWRDARQSFIKSAVGWLTVAVLSAMAIGMGHKYLNGGE